MGGRRTIEQEAQCKKELEKIALYREHAEENLALVLQELTEWESVNSPKPKQEDWPVVLPAEFLRKKFVDPILKKKGWSIEDWANEAQVADRTARDYLNGSKNPFRSSRVKLAKALGVSEREMPE